MLLYNYIVQWHGVLPNFGKTVTTLNDIQFPKKWRADFLAFRFTRSQFAAFTAGGVIQGTQRTRIPRKWRHYRSYRWLELMCQQLKYELHVRWATDGTHKVIYRYLQLTVCFAPFYRIQQCVLCDFVDLTVHTSFQMQICCCDGTGITLHEVMNHFHCFSLNIPYLSEFNTLPNVIRTPIFAQIFSSYCIFSVVAKYKKN